MYHLKLYRARSYRGIVYATRDKPDVFVEDEATADKLVASGYFRLIGEAFEGAETGEGVTAASGHLDMEQLEKMKVPDLEALAKQMGIDTKNFKKAQIIDAIAKVEISTDLDMDSDADGEDGGGIDYGEGDD